MDDKASAILFWASKNRFSISECEELAKDLDAHDTMTFDLVGPTGRLKAKWLDAYFSILQIEGMDEGTMTLSSAFKYVPDVHCENLSWPGAPDAQGMAAGTDETAQQAQPEGQQPDGEAMRPETTP